MKRDAPAAFFTLYKNENGTQRNPSETQKKEKQHKRDKTYRPKENTHDKKDPKQGGPAGL